ncbi:MAG: hypothetical protein RQ885_03035 [Desulfurococcales archaeon]|nr:hypothetical protein [Desulfurococcales archaeon]
MFEWISYNQSIHHWDLKQPSRGRYGYLKAEENIVGGAMSGDQERRIVPSPEVWRRKRRRIVPPPEAWRHGPPRKREGSNAQLPNTSDSSPEG